MMKEMILLDETTDYLKFKVENLKVSKIIDLIVEGGQNEELHLVELEILIYCLKNLYPDEKENLIKIINILDEFIEKQRFLEIDCNFRDFYNQISNIKIVIDTEKMINGEILSYKGSFHSDFDIKLN